jgi:hypothetical protein
MVKHEAHPLLDGLRLVGPDITVAQPTVRTIGTVRAALVRGWAPLSARRAVVDGRVACVEGLRLCRATVVGQGAEQGIVMIILLLTTSRCQDHSR